MEPILDETSLLPCNTWKPSVRIRSLALTLQSLDALGVSPVLRSVRDAPDLDIGAGRGLRGWCFDHTTDRDAGRLVANRLGKQPFIDGAGGLLALAEGARAIEAKAHGITVLGLAVAALNECPSVALGRAAYPEGNRVLAVTLTCLDETGEYAETVTIPHLVTPDDVTKCSGWIVERIDRDITNGDRLLLRAVEVFPFLRFGARARSQIRDTIGSEPVFRQLIRHLRALNHGARDWNLNTPFVPAGAVTWSSESNATLSHGKYGPMRDFPVPDGFAFDRWSRHTKLSNGVRLYFREVRMEEGPVVLIGYFGAHLPTVEFPN